MHGLHYIFPRDCAAIALVMSSGLYERLTTIIFKRLVKQSSIVVDVGAGFGYYTLLAAKLINGSGRVFAFEPEPVRYEFLLRNIYINAFTNVIAINKAISDKSGKADFFIRGEMSSLANHLDYKHRVTVETTSLDNYFKNDSKIALIKMDIEGAEMRALAGMETTLSKNRDLILIMEFAPNLLKAMGDQPEELIKTLIGHEFKLYAIDELKSEIKRVDLIDLVRKAREDKHYSVHLLCIRRNNLSKLV